MSAGFTVMGTRLTPDVRNWSNKQRKVGSLLAFYAALVVTIGGLLLWILWGGPQAVRFIYWILVGLLVAVLVFVVLLMVLKPAAPKAQAAPAAAEAAPAEATEMGAPVEAPAEPAPPAGPQAITLRCGDCGTIFDVTDTGERPLYHTCPGCGAEGQLDAAPEATPAAPAAEAAPWAPPAEEAPAAAAPAAAMKKLRLRCGGCKQVFSIDDTGERPLKRPCPHCGRMGQIS